MSSAVDDLRARAGPDVSLGSIVRRVYEYFEQSARDNIALAAPLRAMLGQQSMINSFICFLFFN